MTPVEQSKARLEEIIAGPWALREGDKDHLRAILVALADREAECREADAAMNEWADAAERMETRAELAEAKLSALVEVVITCREQFRFYAQQHAAKTPPDYTKAQTNLDMVTLCDNALGNGEG